MINSKTFTSHAFLSLSWCLLRTTTCSCLIFHFSSPIMGPGADKTVNIHSHNIFTWAKHSTFNIQVFKIITSEPNFWNEDDVTVLSHWCLVCFEFGACLCTENVIAHAHCLLHIVWTKSLSAVIQSSRKQNRIVNNQNMIQTEHGSPWSPQQN